MSSQNADQKTTLQSDQKTLRCGVIMPISAMAGYTAEHWAEVLDIIKESVASIESNALTADIVSQGTDAAVIHRRIVQGIYDSPIVVCDVSGKNPNVMFELGMRLAFDKPTVIIKDDQTDYSFDISPIEHIQYPKDLRFNAIVKFKCELAAKVEATLEQSRNPDAPTFLQSFHSIKIKKLSEEEVPFNDAVINMLASLQSEVMMLRSMQSSRSFDIQGTSSLDHVYPQFLLKEEQIERRRKILKAVTEYASLNQFAPLTPSNSELMKYLKASVPVGGGLLSQPLTEGEVAKAIAMIPVSDRRVTKS